MKIEKVEKPLVNFDDKKEHVIYMKRLKHALGYELVFKNFHRVNNFNQKAWLKPYIDMHKELRNKAKYDFKRDFFQLMNNAIFLKTVNNVRKHRGIKLVTTVARKNYLVSERNYRTTKFFYPKFISHIEMKKRKYL